MNEQPLSITMTLDQAPDEVYAAINDVSSWWSGQVVGPTDRVGTEFTYRYGDVHYSVQHITELAPGERVAWRVVEANLPAVEPADEWNGTEITFDLTPAADGSGTELTFTHVGLAPSCACYDRCASGWDALIATNLRARIATGQPQPDVFAAMA